MSTPPNKTKPSPKAAKRRVKLFGRRWKLYALVALAGPLMVFLGVLGYYYVVFSRMIDVRLHGDMQRVDPRVFARPFEVRRGQSVSPRQLVDRLNELGYANRAQSGQPGEFTVGRDAIVLVPRDGDRKGQTVRIVFGMRSAKTKETTAIDHLEIVGAEGPAGAVDARPAAHHRARVDGTREAPGRPAQEHPASTWSRPSSRSRTGGSTTTSASIPIGIASAVWDYATGRKAYLRGGSTLTQQLIKNTFLTQERSPIRKMQDQFMALILERRLTKDQVLELYLNDVWLGQRGSFAVHGVAEASRLFFAKDISNVSLSEAALIAGVIQSPPRHSPFVHPDRAKERRDVVLRAMADAGFVSAEAADRATQEPVQVVARALEAEAPYFVDYISQELQDKYSAIASTVDVYTTLDLHLQRLAQDAVRDGLIRVDELLAKRKRQKAQAALIAVDPRTGESARDGRGPLLQSVPIQPRHQRAPAARLGLQAVRLPGGVRTRVQGRAHATSRRRRSSSTSRRRSCSTTNRGNRATTRTSTTGR